MSNDMDSPQVPGGPVQRDETDDDYDLLTYNEAGARLAEEIERETRRLKEYESRPPGEADPHATETSRSRVAALREAQQRIGARTLNASNFERFFGYPPPTPGDRPA
ncbi:hypothetical protein ACIQNU_18175 [Streptomyces sp. NPDC091292]|uniref:hypothetical protein n=1 Tax=Streptomyces sp. NPDC091292 TaxID=3365991 RepID=UPI00381367D4